MLGYRLLVAGFVAVTVSLGGCGGSQEATTGDSSAGDAHDHGHDHPEPTTLAEAVGSLEEFRDELAASYKSGDVKAVDEAWHEMDPVARKASELIGAAGMDRYDQEDAEKSANQIVEVLKALHPPHGADAKVDSATYEAEAESLNDAIENLKKLSEKVATANSDE